VGQTLQKADDVVYVSEPDNRRTSPFADVGKLGLGYMPFLTPDEPAPRYEVLWEVAFRGGWPQTAKVQTLWRAASALPRGARVSALTALGRRVAKIPPPEPTVICKSVYAALALEWVVAHTGCRPIIIRRHPLNVLASWLELEVPPHPAQDPRLQEKVQRSLGIEGPPPDASLLQRSAWSIGVLDAAVVDALGRHSEWLSVSHEELCGDPAAGFRSLFEQLGLEWSEEVDRYLKVADRPGAGYLTERLAAELPDAWQRRLSPDQVREAEEVLAALSAQTAAAGA
jgi:hypothetical protein